MKLPVLLTLSGTVVAVLALSTFLLATDRDPTLLITILVAAVPALGAAFGINAVSKDVNTIKTQTNGTMTALRAENSGLRQETSVLRSVLPVDVASNIPTTAIVTVDPTQAE